jgi:ABC-type Fe3+/spermidine/putrescine transport system ATPase subunit
MNQSKLELQNVKITLDENVILNDINLSIQMVR